MAKQAHLPPKKTKEFKRLWARFIPKVVERENFSEAHLEQLSILCDLYIEYDELTAIISECNKFVETETRYGITLKEHPAYNLRSKTLAEVRHYSKLLDLVLVKDKQVKDDGKEEWS